MAEEIVLVLSESVAICPHCPFSRCLVSLERSASPDRVGSINMPLIYPCGGGNMSPAKISNIIMKQKSVHLFFGCLENCACHQDGYFKREKCPRYRFSLCSCPTTTANTSVLLPGHRRAIVCGPLLLEPTVKNKLRHIKNYEFILNKKPVPIWQRQTGSG